MSSVDPVAQPAEYQRLLLSFLGDDDPAAVQAETPGRLAALLDEAGDRLRTRPEEGEWSVLEVAGHMLDAELVLAGRYRWIIAHDEPPLIGYDQDLWSDGLHHNDDDPGELLSFFGALRRANLDLWKRTSAQERQRVGMHAERGPESLDLSFRLMAGHDRLHLEQTARTVRAVAGRTSG